MTPSVCAIFRFMKYSTRQSIRDAATFSIPKPAPMPRSPLVIYCTDWVRINPQVVDAVDFVHVAKVRKSRFR